MSKPYVRTTAVGSIPGGLVRTRYFDGMLLSQADLDTDQRYWLNKRRLTNRALGHGVVWGLRIELDEQRQTLVLHEGYGIDCCGNDLVIGCPTRVPTRDLLDDHPSVAQMLALAAGQAPQLEGKLNHDGEFMYDHPCADGIDGPQSAKVRAALMLEYLECPSEPRPVIRDGCGSGRGDGCEYSRVVESSRLVLRPMPTRDPGPIERALEQLAALQEQLPELFPSLDHVAEVGAPPMTLVVRVLHQMKDQELQLGEFELKLETIPDGWIAEHKIQFELPPLVWVSEEIEVPLQELDTRLVLAFEIRPTAGWLFTDGYVGHNGQNAELVTEIAAPYALQLAWRWLVPLVDTDEFNLDVELREWILAPLFHNGQRPYSSMSPINAAVRIRFDGDAVRVVVGTRWQIPGGELVMLDPVNEPPETCLTHLGLAGAGERISLTLLAGLAAWLWDELRFDPEQGIEPPELTGPRTLAVWIYTIAWRTLFGAHASSPEVGEDVRERLGELLNDLLRMWCEGMIYRGHRCGSSHGVTLGSVQLDADGRFAKLDIWDGRRHVITGPLLNHWLGQFGVEPIDVVAGRIAKAICCVASDCVPKFWALPKLPSGALTQLEGRNDNLVFGELPFAEQAVLLSDGCYLTYGPTAPIVERLEALGVEVVEREVVGRGRFFALMLAGLRGSKAPATRRYAMYSLDGNDGVTAQLLIARPECVAPQPSKPGPSPDAPQEFVPKPHADHMAEMIDRYVGDVRPAARALVGEFVTVLANSYRLELYGDSPIEPDKYGFAGDVEFARAIDLRTVGSLVSLEFDEVLRRARTINVGAEQTVALERAYARSEHLIERLVASVALLIPAVPTLFTPKLLRDDKFSKGLYEVLEASAKPDSPIPGISGRPAVEQRIFPFAPPTHEQIQIAARRAVKA